MNQPLFEYLLRLGDDSLVLGQRLGEWCGHAPTIEIDLSLTNLSLDLIGQATLLLDHAGKVEAQDRDADRLAFHRDELQFRNCLLVEQPNGDFGQTIARQFLFSTWQHALYGQLAKSNDLHIAAIAAKAVKEIAYHADLSAEWVIRLGDGTGESHARMVDGFGWMWRFIDELFQMDAVDIAMLEAGTGVDKALLRPAFDARLADIMGQATLPVPPLPRAVTGGRAGHHSEHLGLMLAVMQHLPRSHPDAQW